MLKVYYALAFFILLLICALYIYKQISKITIKNKLEKYINTYQDFSGSILIADKGSIIFEKSYGMADYENSIPNSINTTFKIGSLAKQFTAMCIMILQEKGLLNVNDKISKFIPEYPDGNKISIHNLLTMSVGIPNYMNDILFEYYNLEAGVYKGGKLKDNYFSPWELIDLFKDKPLNYEPGLKYEYSNSNYVILGYIIEKLSNMSYKDFVKNNIFVPLNMNSSGYSYDELSSGTSIGYDKLTPEPVKAFSYDTSILYSAGGLYSTVEDLYKWDKALYTKKLVKKETLKSIFKPYIKIVDRSNYCYGYGWIVDKLARKPLAEHVGSVPGFLSYIYRDENTKRTIIILSNNMDYYIKLSQFYAGIMRILKGPSYTK